MAVGLPSLHDRVGRLQTSLQAKAKAEPAYRFYTLWDKVCRADVLVEAYRRCRANRGAPGVDGETFEAIEAHGVEAWLERLRQELCARAYRPRPLLRVSCPAGVSTRRMRRSEITGESRMREIRTSGSTSGDGKRSHAKPD